MDVGDGDIRITPNGAAGETNLNPKGYWITGTTSTNNVIVERGVKTEITLDNVNITASTKVNCIDVSHADVTITLRGENLLNNESGSSDTSPGNSGNGLNKDGMDGSLTIQCESSDQKGHKCDERCGSLKAHGNPNQYHAGAIGSSWKNHWTAGENGFCNFTIKGGNIEASGGGHTAGIGSACDSDRYGAYTKNITISGGNVTATGTEYGAGIGSGFGNKVDGITITGGVVKAYGGQYAPGIGAAGYDRSYAGPSEETRNVSISGGDTLVIAVGHEGTGMPGIGSGAGNSKVFDVTASPEFGYQGYIQDGVSETEYSFTEGTPFKEKTDIRVGQFFTMVYFGPFRDVNEIENTSNEQIGANHIISKSGGEAFTKEQLKGLAKVTGKQESGLDFPEAELTFADEAQIEAINEAKKAGKTGEFPLTFQTPNKTKTTITVYLKADGTDAGQMDPGQMDATIGADDFTLETGGSELTEDDARNLAGVKGKDADGTTYDIGSFTPDADQLKALNESKKAGKAGEFPLTFTSPDGKKAVVTVTLFGDYDKVTVNPNSGETIKANHVISRTGGKEFTEDQLKKLTMVRGLDSSSQEIPLDQITLPDTAQLKAINEAKKAGKTGEYPLTLMGPGGTQTTVTVYLTEEGTDGAEWTEGKVSLGADSASHLTGGKGFTKEELIGLCRAKGKNKYGDNLLPSVDERMLNVLNEAKEKGKTGTFPMVFSLADGTKAEVTVTLTGDHTVSFDPDGGDFQPKDQTVVGGRTAVEPKEPKKEGYVFEGWYYTDENGKEIRWDFDTPVNEDLKLKARWKKAEKEAAEDTPDVEKTGKGTESSDDQWKYQEVDKASGSGTAKTGDVDKIPWIFGCLFGAAGLILIGVKKKIRD